MKINFTLWGTGITGGVRVIFEVANRLARRGHRITITALGGDHHWFRLEVPVIYVKPPKWLSLSEKIVAPYIKVKYGYPSYKIYPRVRSILNKFGIEPDLIKPLSMTIPDCDINVATFFPTAFTVHRSGKGVPFYYMQHYETIFLEDTYSKRVADESYLLPLYKVANSTWLKNTLKKRLNVESYGPVIPGVNLDIFYPRKIKKTSNDKVILSLGKSTKWKGLWDLFEALKVVQKDVPNIKLVLYGSEPYLKNSSPVPCDYLAKISDTKLADLYSMADVVVTPSWCESSPLPPLEAMACGTPVVATRYGTEDYCFHEENSLVVPPRDPKALAGAILRILKDQNLREKLKREGVKTAKQFTWDKTVDKVEELFKNKIRD